MKKYMLLMCFMPLLCTCMEVKIETTRLFDSYASFQRSMDGLDEEAQLDDLLQILFNFREAIIRSGCPCDLLSNILIQAYGALQEEFPNISEDEFLILLAKIKNMENPSLSVKF